MLNLPCGPNLVRYQRAVAVRPVLHYGPQPSTIRPMTVPTTGPSMGLEVLDPTSVR